jgi:hypothetical protein
MSRCQQIAGSVLVALVLSLGFAAQAAQADAPPAPAPGSHCPIPVPFPGFGDNGGRTGTGFTGVIAWYQVQLNACGQNGWD